MNYINYQPIMEPKSYLKASNIGATTSPQTANQLEQFTNLLNQGIVNIELAPIQPEIFESIPDEHLREIKRLSELTGSKPSLHAPLIEPSGFTQQGWNETTRKENERQLIDAVKRAKLLDPNGNIPVNLHGANVFGAEWDRYVEEEYRKSYEEASKEKKEIMAKVEHMPRMMAIVDQQTGQITPLEYEKKYRIGEEKEEIWDPYKRLASMNETKWDQEKLKIMSYNKEINELRERQIQLMADIVAHTPKGKILPGDEEKVMNLNREARAIEGHIKNINDINRSQFNDMHHTILRYGEEGDKKDYKEKIYPMIKKEMDDVNNEINKVISKNKDIFKMAQEGDEDARRKAYELQKEIERLRSISVENMTKFVSEIPTPELFKPVNEFAKEKASETLANVAFESFKRFGEKMPLITVENSYPMMPLSRADDLKKVIEKTREQFVDKIIKEKKISRKEAEKISEKVIGATWDVGHINMLRKGGYTEEDIIAESKKIAPLVKHVHVTDNFGFSDTHLPPDMGNVPIKKILDLLKKEGASPEKIRHIVEAGGFVQHFKESPFPYILEAMNSPIYNVSGSPYWTGFRDIYAPYSMGYGDMLPGEHFKLYGAGFSGMPRELGGEVGGDKSRFAGAPNQ